MSDFAIATHVYLPKSVNRICEDAFTPKRKVTIHAAAGSYAESFAKENNIKVVAGYCQELCAKSLQAAERSVVMQWRDR